MKEEPSKISIRSKVWLQDEDGMPVFGQGRIKILAAIEKHGSIKSAAEALGMSFRGAWSRIQATEKRLGQPLLTRRVGGRSGGGSELTPFAKELVRRFDLLCKKVEHEADKAYEKLYGNIICRKDDPPE